MSMVPFGNLGELSKPMSDFINKIGHVIGEWWEPHQRVRLAKADAKADLIRAVGDIKVEAIKELADRAGKRIFYEELRNQDNMESIIDTALLAINEKAKPQDVQDDWIANFFDKCRLISDEEMQALWARILAGEANSPGKFSKKTVNLVANLDKSDAEAFTRLCGFGFWMSGIFEILVYNLGDDIYKNRGIHFDRVSLLESIGLVQHSPLTAYSFLALPSAGYVSYFDQKVWLEFPPGKKPELDVGHVLLTEVGRQLVSVCKSSPVDGFTEYVKEKWKGFGYKVEP
jgi:hypothetical protein